LILQENGAMDMPFDGIQSLSKTIDAL
jgi:hypothetical protein